MTKAVSRFLTRQSSRRDLDFMEPPFPFTLIFLARGRDAAYPEDMSMAVGVRQPAANALPANQYKQMWAAPGRGSIDSRKATGLFSPRDRTKRWRIHATLVS